MAGGSDNYHEPYEVLRPETRDVHRAIISVMEELEAIDWYQQRADACGDDELRGILLHNKEEEMEHAAMGLEWLRRRLPNFRRHLETYLDADGAIVAAEAEATNGDATEAVADGSLAIGSLRGES